MRAIKKILSSFAPDLVIIQADYHYFLHTDFIMGVVPRLLPGARIMSFLDESVLSPVEWLPQYLRVSNDKPPERTAGPDSIKLYQKLVLKILEDRIARGSDMVLTETSARMDTLNGRNMKQANLALIRVMRHISTPYQVLQDVNVSSEIIKREGYEAFMSRRDESSSTQPGQDPIPGHSSRDNILFIGTGNNELDYQGLMWFDRNLVHHLKNGIPDIKVHVLGENW